MRGWVIAGLVVLACATQTSFLLPFTLFGVRPDLVLVVVCAIGLVLGSLRGAAAGFFAGLLVDVLTGRLVGLGALSKGAAGYAAGWMGQRLFRENLFVPAGIALAVSVGEGVLYILGTHAFGVPIPLIAGAVHIVLPEAWYNALAAVLLFPLLFRALRFADAVSNARRPGPVEG